jgi:hypothetical protein
MNQTFWNHMYSAADYAYGVEPNDFLTTVPFKANSKILCLAEGQGRNAVYLATLLSIQKIQRTIHEGSYHNGESSVIQVIAQKC